MWVLPLESALVEKGGPILAPAVANEKVAMHMWLSPVTSMGVPSTSPSEPSSKKHFLTF